MLSSCYKETEFAPDPNSISAILTINDKPVSIDQTTKGMLFPIESYGEFSGLIEYNERYNIFINDQYVVSGDSYNFNIPTHDSSFSVDIVYQGQHNKYQLEFTLLPIVRIYYNYKKILDEPKGPAVFSLVPVNGKCITEHCGVETRGGTANLKPKKSIGIEFWDDFEYRKEKNQLLLGMYTNDDWMLDAMYIDPSKMRNRVSFDLWEKMQNDALGNDLDVLKSTIHGRYVEVFMNDEYHGLYCLSELFDAEHLGITDKTEQTGYLYKSEGWTDATRIVDAPCIKVDADNHWCGWEQKFPEFEEEGEWKPLYNFVKFVAESSDEQFKNELSQYLVVDQVIDFYLLASIMYGYDNVGKNCYLASESKNMPFYILPWDMDATWGCNHRGEHLGHDKPITPFLLERLVMSDPEGFTHKLKKRYSYLRENLFTLQMLNSMFIKYEKLLVVSGASKRENERWPKNKSDLHTEVGYISEWIECRMDYLDEYFENLHANQSIK